MSLLAKRYTNKLDDEIFRKTSTFQDKHSNVKKETGNPSLDTPPNKYSRFSKVNGTGNPNLDTPPHDCNFNEVRKNTDNPILDTPKG